MKHLITTIAILTIVACDRSELEQQKTEETKKEQSPTESNYNSNYWVTDGNIESDTILVICPGGPKWELDLLAKGKTVYRYIPRYDSFGIAYVHQSQNIDKRIMNLKTQMSLESSKQEVVKNTTMLEHTISYYKRLGKVVIVIGKSHGAYVVQEYLAQSKDMADKYFILAGRLAMNREMTEQQLRGFNGEFSEDGLRYLPEDEDADLSEYSEQEQMQYRNKQMLKAGYGSNNYTETLSNIDLSKVTYLYGSSDSNIGALTQAELSFLKEKKVEVIEKDTDHSGVTYAFIDGLENGEIELIKNTDNN